MSGKSSPTKRQIAKLLRTAAKRLRADEKVTNALFTVAAAHGKRSSLYYDGAVTALKARLSFRVLLAQPTPIIRTQLRRTARALEHGLAI